MTAHNLTKGELRSAIRASRKLGLACGEAHSLRLIELIVRNGITYVSAYEEFDNEPSLLSLRSWCDANGVELLLPTIKSETELSWSWHGEPRSLENAELVIMPALAAGKDGSRLGRGKGYYDRAVATLSTPRVVVVHDTELFENLPVEDFDQPADAIVTCSDTLLLNSRLK